MTDADPNGALTAAVNALQVSVEQLRNDLVRKDVYDAERNADRAEVATVAADVAEIKGTLSWLSRTLVASLVIPVLTSAVVVYFVQQGAR